MKYIKVIATFFLLAASAALSLAAAAAPKAGPTVKTMDGPVTGFVKDGVNTFLGIPYAAPPIGDLRWRPPQRPEAWTKPLKADAYGNACAQTNTLGVFAEVSYHEDCLFLNVFAPEHTSPARSLPVMVWIHGGGHMDGQSNDYDGSKLVKDGNTVVVTINYRLNVFGFLAHPALDNEGHPFANYGLMDEQFALQWVQQNIRAFGGDPDNVTIFGESAGGQSVLANMASPTARGLFHRGIAQSGAAFGTWGSGLSKTLEDGEKFGRNFARAVGCEDQTAACLRSLTAREILSRGVDYTSEANQLITDGTILPLAVPTALATGKFNRVPFMDGTTLDELRWIAGLTELTTGEPLTAAAYPDTIAATFGEEAAPQILKRYALRNYASPSLALAAASTDDAVSCPAHKVNQWVSRYVKPTYAFEFADRTAPSYMAPVSFPYGAAHTFEIQYLFPLYHGASGAMTPLNKAQSKLSDEMVAYWSTFAATGDPNKEGLLNWPSFTPKRASYIVLNIPKSNLSTDFAEVHNCALWQEIWDQR